MDSRQIKYVYRQAGIWYRLGIESWRKYSEIKLSSVAATALKGWLLSVADIVCGR